MPRAAIADAAAIAVRIDASLLPDESAITAATLAELAAGQPSRVRLADLLIA